MTSSPTFGTLLRQLRKRAGMTQGDLAAAVGYSVSFISDLEQNRRLPAVAIVLQQFIPALGLQAEANFAARLVELAALARGERLPSTLTVQRTTQLTVTETFPFSPDAPWARLPAPPTPLIGRDQTIKMLCNRLQGHHGRLLTLVGPPGVGKTRLGLAVASQMGLLFKDGARVVALAAVTDAELVATIIANELELPDTGRQSPPMRLIRGLRHKHLLLLLDNFEQIIAAAPLLATLLTACPALTLLVTSRERLHLRAEQRFPVLPLDLDFAVALFVQGVQAVVPTFTLTPENQPLLEKICRRLDCLPLAIELIAARGDLFSPQMMLDRLEEQGLALLTDGAQDAPAHQRTLRTAIQYSYALLDERERMLLRTLGVFAGGFDLAAVAYFGFDLEVLQGLIHKSLVQIADPSSGRLSGGAERRFLLLETVRDYAREQLAAHQSTEEAQRQHADYYTQWVESIADRLHGSQTKADGAKMETEHNNVRAALAWTLAQGNAEAALRLSGAAGQFWLTHSHVREGKRWLAQALALGTNTPSAGRAKALIAAGRLDFLLGDVQAAQTFFEQGLYFYQVLNDRRGMAWAFSTLGSIAYAQSAYVQAQLLFQKSLALYEAVEDKWGAADLYTSLGWLALSQGDYEAAQRYFIQGLTLRREQGEDATPTTTLKGLASIASQQQDYPQANAYFAELLARAREVEDPFGIAHALNHLGRIAIYQGNLVQAASYLAEGFGIAQELDYPALLRFVLDNQGNLAFAQGHYAAAIHYYTQSLEMARQLADKFNVATLFERLASVMGAQQKAVQATRLLGAAANLHEAMGAPLRPIDQPRYQQSLAVIHAQLDDATFATAWHEGMTMTLDEAVAYAVATRATE